MKEIIVYDDRQTNLIFDNIVKVEEALISGISIELKFTILMISIPKETRDIIYEKIEPFTKIMEIKRKQFYGGMDNRTTNSDAVLFLINLYRETYSACLSIVIDEIDILYKGERSGKTINPATKFG